MESSLFMYFKLNEPSVIHILHHQMSIYFFFPLNQVVFEVNFCVLSCLFSYILIIGPDLAAQVISFRDYPQVLLLYFAVSSSLFIYLQFFIFKKYKNLVFALSHDTPLLISVLAGPKNHLKRLPENF